MKKILIKLFKVFIIGEILSLILIFLICQLEQDVSKYWYYFIEYQFAIIICVFMWLDIVIMKIDSAEREAQQRQKDFLKYEYETNPKFKNCVDDYFKNKEFENEEKKPNDN